MPEPETPVAESTEELPPAEPGDPLTTLQTENARLKSETEALRAETARLRQPPAASAAPKAAVTIQDIEAAYQAGQITLEQRDQAVDDLKFQTRYQQMRGKEQAEARDRDATQELWTLRRQYPDLGRAGSPLLTEVEDRLEVLARRGSDPTLTSTQLTAVEFVLADRRARVTTTRQDQHDIPVSTGGSTFGGGPPITPIPRNEFADIPNDVQSYWTRTGLQKAKWPAYAEAYRAQQARKAARSQAMLGRAAG